MHYLFLLAVMLGGMAVSTQASINGELGKKIGVMEASFISFSVGTLALALLVLFGGKGNLLQVFSVPKWQLLGGILGAFYIFVIILGVPRIGAASAILGAIMGQIIFSMIIDHYGFFGVPHIPFDWVRLTGVILMGAGLYLVFHTSISS